MPGATRQTHSHRSSLIAAGTRIEGTVIFAGTLHLRGEISGDVRCSDHSGTLVVDAGGTLNGSAAAPSIIVRGRLVGPMQAAQTIAVEAGGSSVGTASYRSLAIYPGGTVDGLLTPLDSAAGARPVAASRPTPPPTLDAAPTPRPRPQKKPDTPGNRSTRNLALAITAVLIVVATLYWTKRDASPRQSAVAALPELVADSASESADGAATTEPAAPAPEKSAATPKAAPDGKPSERSGKAEVAVAAKAAPERPDPATEKKPLEPAERPEPDLDTVFAIKGANGEKSATTIYLITREPVVIYKKMPDASGKGTRLAFSRGRNTGIRIAPGELLRVAQGEDVDLFFQGGKVWANPIESGAWMRFEAIEPPPPPPKKPPLPTPVASGAAPAAPASAPTAPAAEQPAAAPKAAGG